MVVQCLLKIVKDVAEIKKNVYKRLLQLLLLLLLLRTHCQSSPGSSDECSTQRQVAADLWTKPISLSQ